MTAAIDGLWPSRAAYHAVSDLVEDPARRFEFYWMPYIYHTRWKELSERDFEEISDYGAGGAWLINRIENFDGSVSRWCDKDVLQDVPEINLEYIEKLMLLCAENDSELVLLTLPIPMGAKYQPLYNALEKWAGEKGIPFINGYDEPNFWQLDYGTDFADQAHMNIHGIKKSSKYIGDYLAQHYDFDEPSNMQICSLFDANLKEYAVYKDSIWSYPMLSYGDAITFATDGNYNQFYGGTMSPEQYSVPPSGSYTWTTGPRSDFYFYIEEPADALLRINLQAVQPIAGKGTRTVDIYVNERFVSSIEFTAEMGSSAFSVDIDKDLWTGPEEQKITFKYPEITSEMLDAMSQNYTLGLQEIYLERK